MTEDLAILTGSRSWSGTPWDYSSMRFLQFQADGQGLAVYGYGQTIHAKINFHFELPAKGRLRLAYLDSPAYQSFTGYVATPGEGTNELTYSLTDSQEAIRESITGLEFTFRWKLDLSSSLCPDSIVIPRAVPLTYYGYREAIQRETR